MFEVSYDPSATQASTMLSKISALGFKPRLSKPVAAVAKQTGIAIQAQASVSAVKRGGKLKVMITLVGSGGKKIAKKGETTVTFSGPDSFTYPKAANVKGGKKKAGTKATIKVNKKAAKGSVTITVTVKYTLAKGKETTTGQASLNIPVEIK